ncbi:DUF910 family protein [Sediminibacillus dalangtanensis]|uniref:DUF910 family protein n=1 Tax=Sediminibacillus dalangtanensis TaxID=2729421 RepID=A0ABX7VW46_9BACI|nr:YqgQ family protein [Sediminibacillus dalangtanensis]QTM99825.1 DUF910 family protein [Sediminibacillus dalangtanensis]
MKTIYDIQQYLKKFGTFIYLGDRIADLDMMEDEVRELYKAQCMETRDFQSAILLLKQEKQKLMEQR